MKFWPQFVVAFGAWILLAWPFQAIDPPARSAGELWAQTGDVDLTSIIAGAVVALLVALVAHHERGAPLHRLLDPRRWLWALAFAAVLTYHVVLANFDVARRVLSPSLPIRPGIVKIRTGLTSTAGQTLLATAITLTPGTLTVDVGSEPGVLYVHWIDVEQQDVQAATEQIAGRFAWLIAKIIEEEPHA